MCLSAATTRDGWSSPANDHEAEPDPTGAGFHARLRHWAPDSGGHVSEARRFVGRVPRPRTNKTIRATLDGAGSAPDFSRRATPDHAQVAARGIPSWLSRAI